jgi:hypothetical protein
MAKSYEQPNISTDYISVASPRVFLANYGATPDLAADIPYVLDIAAAVVTDGWYDMGPIESVQMPVTKDFVKYEAGATRTTRKMFEKGRTAQVTFNYREMMPYIKAFCSGATVFNTVAGSATTTTGSPTRTTVDVTSAAGLSVGDTIGIAATSGGITTSYNMCVITAINSNTLTVTGLMAAPGSSDAVQQVTRTEYKDPLGTITERSILMFFDYEVTSGQDNQYLVWFPKVVTNAAYAPDFKDNNDYMAGAVTFEALTTTQTLDDSTSKTVLYRAWDIGKQ